MGAAAISAESLPGRMVLRSHLAFLCLAAVALAAAVEGAAGAGGLGGWRVLFLPVTVLHAATPFLAYAWIVAVARSALPVEPAGRGPGTALAGWMAARTLPFLGYLLVLAALNVAGAAVNLWSLAPAAPFEVLHRSLLAGWPELSYAVAVGLVAWTLSALRAERRAA